MKMTILKRLLSCILCAMMIGAPPGMLCTAQEEGADSGDQKHTIKDFLVDNLPPQEGRRVVLDEITGLLTITDTPSNHRIALDLIREWDVGPQQVEIEAKFIEITFTDIDEMGVEWKIENNIIGTGPASSPGGGSSPTFSGTSLIGSSRALEALQLSGMGFLIGKATMTANQVRMYIRALEQSGKANLLNAPRVTTIDGQMANFQVVRTIPYATETKRTTIEFLPEDATAEISDDSQLEEAVIETYTIEEERIGVVLEVTPTIVEGANLIELEIHPEVTKISSQVPITGTTPSELGWPIVDTRTAQTSIIIKSGETVLIGGLIQDKDSNTIKRKIPLLGDIPLIGNLFKYEYENREKKNLVILVTARLIDSQGDQVR